MSKMPIEAFLVAVEAVQPGLLGTRNVSHSLSGDRVHLMTKDDPDRDIEVWIYPNEDGTFTYERGGAREIRATVDDVVGAVYGNEPEEG